MHNSIMRRCLIALVVALSLVAALVMSACGSSQPTKPIRIGTMFTEDFLPIWVAEEEGLFQEAGVDFEIAAFDSASALSAALTSGEIDIAMTDPMRAIKLCESGTPVTLEWVTLGTTPDQGVFGVLAAPGSSVRSLSDLATSTTGIGLASNTVPEYVFEKLCEQQGIDPATITTHEVASIPDRYGLVAADQIDAAALPANLLELGKASGMIVIADDSTGQNISQSVMVIRDEFDTEEHAEVLARVRAVWDLAAEQINADPEKYRALLIEKTGLNETVADIYPISQYPLASTVSGAAAHPSAATIDSVLAWMKAKGYVTADITYNEEDGTFTIS